MEIHITLHTLYYTLLHIITKPRSSPNRQTAHIYVRCVGVQVVRLIDYAQFPLKRFTFNYSFHRSSTKPKDSTNFSQWWCTHSIATFTLEHQELLLTFTCIKWKCYTFGFIGHIWPLMTITRYTYLSIYNSPIPSFSSLSTSFQSRNESFVFESMSFVSLSLPMSFLSLLYLVSLTSPPLFTY